MSFRFPPCKFIPTSHNVCKSHSKKELSDVNLCAKLLKLFAAATSSISGKTVHAQIIKSCKNSEYHCFIGNTLIHMYVTSGNLQDARKVFDKMNCRDVGSWNSVISGYVKARETEKALSLCAQMHRLGFKFNEFSYGSVLRALAESQSLKNGLQIHGLLVKTAYDKNVYAGSALLNMYAKCGMLDSALDVLGSLKNRTSVSWNALLAVFAGQGNAEGAFWLFRRMKWEGKSSPDQATFVCLVSSVANSQSEGLQVAQIHSHLVKSDFDVDLFIANALITAYGACHMTQNAQKIFSLLRNPDLVSWNAMIAAYGSNSCNDSALQMFKQMQALGIRCNKFTFTSILSACGKTELINQGKSIHSLSLKSGLEEEVSVKNALISMYLGSRSVAEALTVFQQMTERNRVSWNTLISGFVQQGNGEEALKFYNEMQLQDTAILRPDDCTFSALLKACAGLAAIEQGQQIHAQILQLGFETNDFVGSGIIALYSRCGSLDLAEKAFAGTSKNLQVSWNAMIAGYAQHGFCEESLDLFQRMQNSGVRPDHVTFIGVLSACSHAGKTQECLQNFDSMENKYGIFPRMEHFVCVVDCFGRSGRLENAIEFINRMPVKPDGTVWKSLLGACVSHGNAEIGLYAAECLMMELEAPEDCSAYILLSNIYAVSGMWDSRAKVRKIMRERGLRKEPGCSWIQIHHKFHAFVAEDTPILSHSLF